MPDRLFELEKKALHHEDMPQGLTQSEQLFYLSMVKLYELFNCHTYDREQAKNIKQDLTATYRNNAFAENLLNHHECRFKRYWSFVS